MSEMAANPGLVESADDFWDRTGPLPTGPSDVRRFPRFYFRSCAEALVHSLGAKNNETPVHHFVVTSDLSRGGLSLLHKDQLFPGQRLDIILNGEAPRRMEVVWCRRIGMARYAIGCRFVKSEEVDGKGETKK